MNVFMNSDLRWWWTIQHFSQFWMQTDPCRWCGGGGGSSDGGSRAAWEGAVVGATSVVRCLAHGAHGTFLLVTAAALLWRSLGSRPATERESRFRKLEACTLQVFELCHWRQHSHKVDGCPSPEVFPCQQALFSSAQMDSNALCFTDRLFCLGIWEAFGPSHPPSAKKHHHHRPLCGTGQKAAF